MVGTVRRSGRQQREEGNVVRKNPPASRLMSTPHSSGACKPSGGVSACGWLLESCSACGGKKKLKVQMRSSWDDEEAQLGIQLELTVTSILSNPNVLNRTFPGGTDPGGLLNLHADEKVDIF